MACCNVRHNMPQNERAVMIREAVLRFTGERNISGM